MLESLKRIGVESLDLGTRVKGSGSRLEKLKEQTKKGHTLKSVQSM